MSDVLKGRQPERVLHYFEEICGIPHGSGNIWKISDYLVDFAKQHGLSCSQDESGNVLIRKPGTAGYENASPVILQGHMDMVCEKRSDVALDFDNEGLRLGVDGDSIHANGTTLGGDDGIAVAYGLALLESTDIPHPPLEVVFTVDEEIGLLGASAFDCSQLEGHRMINLDSEAEGILWVSCAGGRGVYSHIPVRRVTGEGIPVTVRITGLAGGHSGAEINKGRANANVLAGRFLYGLEKEINYSIRAMGGGEKDNAITRETVVGLLVEDGAEDAVTRYAEKLQADLRREYAGTDDGIEIRVEFSESAESEVLHPISQQKVIFYLMNVPYGVRKMSGSIEGLVETSSNIGVMKLLEEEFYAVSSVRSSVGSAKEDLSDRIRYLTEFLGGEFYVEGDYPAWEFRKDSPLRELMIRVYREQYQAEPEVAAIHAGLECGLFYERIGNLDCVSIGPDMKDIHTSEERLSIASTERVWRYLLNVLRELKDD